MNVVPSSVKGVLDCFKPCWIIVLPLSVAKSPWLTTMKLKAAAMMTKAISTIADSKPMMALFCMTTCLTKRFRVMLRVF